MIHFEVKDNSLIELANELVKGQGDGRISGQDMVKILGKELTSQEQKETLIYILNNYKLTECAKNVLLSRIVISK